MGCGNSKNKIHVVTAAATVDNTVDGPGTPIKAKTNAVQSAGKTRSAGRRQASSASSSRQDAWGSSDSLNAARNNRGNSATSKFSKHSADSGFNDNDREGHNQFVTENSDPDQVKSVEQGFKTPRDLDDFGVVGHGCPQRYSAKDRERLEEQRVMATLEQEGLIQRPVAKATMGLSFDIIQSGGGFVTARPPPRLAKLEKRKKKKKPLTEWEITAKLEKAEARRKELEEQRLARIQQMTTKSDVQNAMDSFAQRQESKDVEQKTKEEKVLENREKKLRERRDRLKAKQEHAEMVRRRRQLNPVECTDEEAAQLRGSVSFSEDTPITLKPPIAPSQ